MNKRIKCYESNAGLYLGAKIALCIANKKDTTNSDTVKDQFEKEVLDKIYELKDKSLIGCFSKRWNSILMWSHYADCHKGVCIEFERPKEGFLDVEYSKRRKSFDLEYAIRTILGHELAKQEIDSHDLKIVNKLLAPYFNKYIDWQYEDEVRCVCLENYFDISKVFNNDINENVYYLKMNTPISKIYIGCRANAVEARDLQEFAKTRGITIKQLMASDEDYCLKEITT